MHACIGEGKEESQGQRSLVGYSPWARKDLDMTEATSSSSNSTRKNGEGNGNPLQYSYLENPVDRGAWWAAIYGVTQSQT